MSCARRPHVALAVFVVLALWLTDPGHGEASSPADFRTIELTYRTEIGPIEAGRGPVHVFLPLPVQSEQQRIASSDVQATIPGRVEIEETYGNRYWHGYLEESDGAPIEVTARLVVKRRVFQRDAPLDGNGRELTDAERDEYGRFLRANERVVVGHAVLDPILAEVREAAGTTERAAVARAIYDWVVDNIEYKKVGTGWGNGDTFWACSERYGNCTDFHALFISLARTEGIPARFEIGFPVPEDRPEGTIGGYHCWVELLLPETGWFPVDASEAFKHPDKRDLFYGTQPADRIHFTTGRDLRLGAGHRGRPLNYFIYPYVEVEGGAYDGRVERSLSYREP